MSDGANLGVTADRALQTIIGGEDSPSGDEITTPEQVAERLNLTPDPCDGPPIWERATDSDAYSLVTDSIAKAFLLVEQDDPGILDRRENYPDDYEYESLRGQQLDAIHCVWKAVMERWPTFDDWIGGASGFQVGFAYNTARFVRGEKSQPNPAILTIALKEKEDE